MLSAVKNENLEYKLTPDIKSQLVEIAKQLHPLPEQVPVMGEMDGLQLIHQGVSTIKKNGKKMAVLVGKKYVVPVRYELRQIDHLHKLRQHYRDGGIMAVHGYLVSLVEHEAKARHFFPQLFEGNGAGKFKGVPQEEPAPLHQ